MKTSGLLQDPIFLTTMQSDALTARQRSRVANRTAQCVYTLTPVDAQAQLTPSFILRNLHDHQHALKAERALVF